MQRLLFVLLAACASRPATQTPPPTTTTTAAPTFRTGPNGVPLPLDAVEAGDGFEVPRPKDAVLAELRPLLEAQGWTIAEVSSSADETVWDITKANETPASLRTTRKDATTSLAIRAKY